MAPGSYTAAGAGGRPVVRSAGRAPAEPATPHLPGPGTVFDQIFRDPELWKLASIPFVAAFVGWATNWVAIRMTFEPLEFVGWRPFLGWQGIIPSKAAKMAGTFVDSTMYRLGTLSEVFEQMDPDAIAEHVVRYIEPRLDGYTDQVMRRQNATLWRGLPAAVRYRVYARVRRSMPLLIDNLVDDVARNVENLVDFKQMITDRLVRDKALLNRLFQESGEREFVFLIRSGAYFGFLFGLVQLAVWVYVRSWWVLPLFGLFVGWATNWIALNLIFRPLEPRRIGRWTLQGLFLKRQAEVAAIWCRIVTREILTVRSLIEHMLYGPRAGRGRRLVRKHIQPVVDEAMGLISPLARVAVSDERIEKIERTVGDKAVAVSSDPFQDPVFNRERAEVVERLLRERMESLPAEQFQDLLRPCFQEDEAKLIALGAVLGLLAGIGQLVFVFGGGAG